MTTLQAKADQALGLVKDDGTGATLIDPGTIILIFQLIYDAYKCVRNAHGLAAKMANMHLPPAPFCVRVQARKAMPDATIRARKAVTAAILEMGRTITAEEIGLMCAEIAQQRGQGV